MAQVCLRLFYQSLKAEVLAFGGLSWPFSCTNFFCFNLGLVIDIAVYISLKNTD